MSVTASRAPARFAECVTIGNATLYCGDFRDVVPQLTGFDAVVTDPPYGETSLRWDAWPSEWPSVLAVLKIAPQMWCFGSTRMFMDKSADLSAWKLAQDVVWEKHNGTNSSNDRFRRVHELACHFYRADLRWADVYKKPQFTMDASPKSVRRKKRPPQWGEIGEHHYVSEDGGPRLMRSVIYARSCHGSAIHPTQKPLEIVEPLVEFSVRPGGSVLDPFMGSGTTGIVCLRSGRRFVGIEQDPEHFDAACRRIEDAQRQERMFA